MTEWLMSASGSKLHWPDPQYADEKSDWGLCGRWLDPERTRQFYNSLESGEVDRELGPEDRCGRCVKYGKSREDVTLGPLRLAKQKKAVVTEKLPEPSKEYAEALVEEHRRNPKEPYNGESPEETIERLRRQNKESSDAWSRRVADMQSRLADAQHLLDLGRRDAEDVGHVSTNVSTRFAALEERALLAETEARVLREGIRKVAVENSRLRDELRHLRMARRDEDRDMVRAVEKAVLAFVCEHGESVLAYPVTAPMRDRALAKEIGDYVVAQLNAEGWKK